MAAYSHGGFSGVRIGQGNASKGESIKCKVWTPAGRTEIVCKKDVFGLKSIHQVRCTKGPIPEIDGSTDETSFRSQSPCLTAYKGFILPSKPQTLNFW